jgi:hypothetical protein
VKLAEDERDVVAAEALALAGQLPDGSSRAAYEAVATAAARGDVPDDLGERLGEVLRLALETGRAGRVHGPEGTRRLLSIWRKTPQAQAAGEATEDVNAALAALDGLPVRSVRVVPSGPGAFSVTFAAGDVEMRLAVGRGDVVLRSVGVGASGDGGASGYGGGE